MAKRGKGRRTVQYNPTYIVIRSGKIVLRTKDKWEAQQKAVELKRAHPEEAIQYGSNDPKDRSNPGAKTLGEYLNAVLQHTRGAHDEGGRIIHETSKSKRQEFGSEIWARRKSHGNPLSKWTPAILDGARVRIRAVGKGLLVDLRGVA